jgi:hypothetical protein
MWEAKETGAQECICDDDEDDPARRFLRWYEMPRINITEKGDRFNSIE